MHLVLMLNDKYPLYICVLTLCLRNKSWKPECVLSFNMDWRIKFTNIRQPIITDLIVNFEV